MGALVEFTKHSEGVCLWISQEEAVMCLEETLGLLGAPAEAGRKLMKMKSEALKGEGASTQVGCCCSKDPECHGSTTCSR